MSTDVAARGLDIPNVDYVIHYDLPNVPRLFVHRSGRCGRNNNKGTNIFFLDKQNQKDWVKIKQATKVEEQSIDQMEFEIPDIS